MASGKTLDVFFRDEIFNPLGMKDTYFHVQADQYHRLVHCCESLPGQDYQISTNAERDRTATKAF